MDAKGRRERALSALQTTQTLCLCVNICTYVDFKAFVCSGMILRDFVCPYKHVVGVWAKTVCTCKFTKCNNVCQGQSREKGVKVWMEGGGEGQGGEVQSAY